jgi:hypothetical protein
MNKKWLSGINIVGVLNKLIFLLVWVWINLLLKIIIIILVY